MDYQLLAGWQNPRRLTLSAYGQYADEDHEEQYDAHRNRVAQPVLHRLSLGQFLSHAVCLHADAARRPIDRRGAAARVS